MKIFSVVKYTLYPFALLYGGIVWVRNRLYDSDFYSAVSFDFPVISVGNLSTGGTGKTPHVEYLLRLLQYRYVVATMSRGYKRHTRGFVLANKETNALKIGDEPMQYFQKFPDAVVSVCEDRMTGIPTLLQRRPDVDVLLLDDAFQHRSVKPGLNLLITEYNKPFYKDQILPYGRLRESRKAYKRADIIVVSKCPSDLTKKKASEIEKLINPFPHQEVYFSTLQYGMPYDFYTGQPAAYRGKHVLMVCGIANPSHLLKEISKHAQGVHELTYPDHYYFITRDIEEMKTAMANWQVENKVIVTTEKDAARLQLLLALLKEYDLPVIVQPVEVQFLLGQKINFQKRIEDFIETFAPEGMPQLPDDITFDEIT